MTDHRVQKSAEFISQNSDYVKVNEIGIENTAKMLAVERRKGLFNLANWKKEELHPQELTETTVTWIFLVSTLNFSFWENTKDELCRLEYKNKIWTGYRVLTAGVMRALQEGIPILNPEYWRTITVDQLKHIFRSINGRDVPLLDKRVEVLREAGDVLVEKFGGKVINIIGQCNKKALKVVELIVKNFKSYQDETYFKGQKVYLYKRAQIFVAELWSCFENTSYGEFDDIDSLTMFADYRVPQALVYFNILNYSPELNITLMNNELLPTGDPREVEIRGNSIWGVELLKKKIQEIESKENDKSNEPLNAAVIDFYLWSYAKMNSDCMDHIPFHKTRSVFY